MPKQYSKKLSNLRILKRIYPHDDRSCLFRFFALLFVVLSIQTIKARRAAQIAIGTGNNKRLERATRVHANFAEYVPLTLLLISFAEQRGISQIMIHFLCLVFLLGRMLHAWSVSQTIENLKFRVVAMMLTFAAIILSALTISYSYFFKTLS